MKDCALFASVLTIYSIVALLITTMRQLESNLDHLVYDRLPSSPSWVSLDLVQGSSIDSLVASTFTVVRTHGYLAHQEPYLCYRHTSQSKNL